MRFIVIFLIFLPFTAMADVLPLYDALRATYVACVGIDEELSDLKTMAGINTAVTAVGTATGVGATVVGLVKASKDSQIEKLEMKKLKKITDSGINRNVFNGNVSDNMERIDQYYSKHKNDTATDNFDTEIDKLTSQSKKLGNWRTGLVATSTATNVAGAIIAGTNKVDKDLKTQIQDCLTSVSNLNASIMQARLNGEDVSEAQAIVRACGEYEYVDVSTINDRATGAMVSSIVGTATGLSGTIVSAKANSSSVRDDNTEAGKKTEKNLNTAANVLSGVTGVASATATVFNATQISAIKKVAAVAEQCTGLLK